MQKYFQYDCPGIEESKDTNIFLKQKYDRTDEIFENRFEEKKEDSADNSIPKSEKTEKSKKSNELKELISQVKRKVPKDDVNHIKMASLVLGNAYLRLAQCQHEIFERSKSYYQKANFYLEGYVGYSVQDEIDLLMMLNKGKYFRNTAEAGKKSDYTRAYNIFSTIENQIENVDITNEKRLHLLLDAKINMGRVSRYGYNFENARRIFLSTIRALEEHIDENIRKELYDLDILSASLADSAADETIKLYLQGVDKKCAPKYILEYLLQALIHIGIIYRKDKEYDNAIKIFELIQMIDQEKNIDALNNLGVCYRKAGDSVGRKTTAGLEEYSRAKKIFETLSKRGNKFASINLYKCQLNCDSPELEEIIETLKKEEGLVNSFHLQFLLGRFYEKSENFGEAIKVFEGIVSKRPYIARGSLGFKVYYNLAQCKIREHHFSEARNILSHIRNMLEKNQKYKDVLTEIDYGWCLMKEGNYHQAITVYEEFQKNNRGPVRLKDETRILNNLADCYIHLEELDKAEACIDRVLGSEETRDDIMAKYLRGVLSLNQMLKSETPDPKHVYEMFEKLTDKKPSELGMNSGWLISALLSYKNSHDEALKEKIIRVITCSSDSFSLKSYGYLAEFILQMLEKENEDKESVSFLCRSFCHIKLNKHGENQAFQFLMNNIDFHNLPREDRAFILAHLVLMYKYILNIKKSCLFTHKDLDLSNGLPYHYTKLSTLKCLLADQEAQKPKLRLWNSIYMNDAYEGEVFDKLLLQGIESGKENLLKAYTGAYITSPMQADSNVYITSFSTAADSFQMWSIYGDNELGAAIKFDENFFDIKDSYYDSIMDSEIGKYSLYKVNYIDTDVFQKDKAKMEDFKNICTHICTVEERLSILQEHLDKSSLLSLRSVAEEIRAFIVDRLNEIRFLFKSPSYEYEQELRLIQCSHKPDIDNQNFAVPRLYIDVEKEIENLTVKLGSKLENQQIKKLSVWLKNTRKVKEIEISNLNKRIDNRRIRLKG